MTGQVLGDRLEGREVAAAVTRPDGGTEVRTLTLGPCGPDDGWLRVEASGICGTDVDLAAGGLSAPTVLGHHVVGRVGAVGGVASQRWGVTPGDLVAVEEYLPCWSCESCRSGLYRLCPQTDLWGRGLRIGLVPAEEGPGLWGGNAEYMYLPGNAVVHRLPQDLPVSLATWTQPLANAVDWVRRVGRQSAGETVVVLGPGYHGLAAAAVARHFGARQVLVGGTTADHGRLEIARRLGADTFDVQSGALHEQVRDRTGGRLADLVLDVAGSSPDSVGAALESLAPQGRLVVAAIKNPTTVSLDTSALVRSMHTVRGVRGRNPESVLAAVDLLHQGGIGLSAVPTRPTGLAETGDMLRRLHAGTGPTSPHVVVFPWPAHDAGTETTTHDPRGKHEQAASIL